MSVGSVGVTVEMLELGEEVEARSEREVVVGADVGRRGEIRAGLLAVVERMVRDPSACMDEERPLRLDLALAHDLVETGDGVGGAVGLEIDPRPHDVGHDREVDRAARGEVDRLGHEGMGGARQLPDACPLSGGDHDRAASGRRRLRSAANAAPSTLRPPGRSHARWRGYRRPRAGPWMVGRTVGAPGALPRRAQLLGGIQWPPLTGNDVPVTQRANGDAKNTTAPAISSLWGR